MCGVGSGGLAQRQRKSRRPSGTSRAGTGIVSTAKLVGLGVGTVHRLKLAMA